MNFLFCYGTLKSDGCANHLLEAGELIGVAKTTSNFQLYSSGWFPMMVIEKNGLAIEGELWKIPQNTISKIDLYEADLFYKMFIELQEPHKEKSVFTYLYRGRVDDLPNIGSKWENL